MARVAVSPASLICLITDIIEIPVTTGQFKKDCSNLARRVGPLTHLLEEISDSSSSTDSDASSSLTSYESEWWWSDLVVGLQAAKCLIYSATSFQALKTLDLAKERRITFNFQSVNWTLEKALGNAPYDRYKISVDVREQVELARSQLRRANQIYAQLRRANQIYAYRNAKLFSEVLSKPIERYAFSNTRRKVTDKSDQCVQETMHSSVSLASLLSKDAEDERLEKADHVNKKSEMIPEDFLCPISLEMMEDPVIISTVQTYERSYIQRWILYGNLTCPKTRQKLVNFTLTPNYVLKSLISQWCTKHNIEQPGDDYINGKTKNRDIYSGNMLAIQALVQTLLSLSIKASRNALIEIRSLSKRSMENRILIARAGAISSLVFLLSSNDYETQENAVTCVLNLSLYEHNKELIMKTKAVISLVEVLQYGTMEARENAAATLFSLSLPDENKIKIGESGAIPALVNLLENGSVRGKKDAATALFSLCGYQENKGRAVRAGIVKPLVKILTEYSSQWIVNEALALLSVLAGNQEARAEIFKAKAIPALVDCLHKEPRNGENAAAILLFLCERDTEKLISIGKLGAVVPILMKLSRDGTERAKRKANSLLKLLRQAA